MSQNFHPLEDAFEIPDDLEDINEINDPYKLLEKAVENIDSLLLLKLIDLCDKDLYLAIILSSFRRILAEGSDDLLYSLGNRFPPHELDLNDYNLLYLTNEFRKAVKEKNDFLFMRLMRKDRDDIFLPYLAKKLDGLLEVNTCEMLSSLAACFTGTMYINEYKLVCSKINQMIGK